MKKEEEKEKEPEPSEPVPAEQEYIQPLRAAVDDGFFDQLFRNELAALKQKEKKKKKGK